MSILTTYLLVHVKKKKGLGDAIYSMDAWPAHVKEGCEPRSLTVRALPLTIVINITVHIMRSGLCKLISQAVLNERRGTNDPWQYLISSLMTYRYLSWLDMVSYLSTWWASWVVEDQIIFNFGLEKCLIRLSLTFPLLWYIPLLLFLLEPL